MMLLAVVVGVLAGLGAYLFEMLLHGIKSGLIRWFPVDSAHILFLIYPPWASSWRRCSSNTSSATTSPKA